MSHCFLNHLRDHSEDKKYILQILGRLSPEESLQGSEVSPVTDASITAKPLHSTLWPNTSAKLFHPQQNAFCMHTYVCIYKYFLTTIPVSQRIMFTIEIHESIEAKKKNPNLSGSNSLTFLIYLIPAYM